MSKRKLRKKIAKQVADKMMYMNTCPNERARYSRSFYGTG